MNATQITKSNAALQQLINSIGLSERERNAALHGAHIRQSFADAVAWVCRKLQPQESSVFAKPSSKCLNPPHEYRRGVTRSDIDMYAML